MNFLFLTTMMILIFSLVSTSMTTSIKTTSIAAKELNKQVVEKLKTENKNTKKLHKKYIKEKQTVTTSSKRKEDPEKHRAKTRASKIFIFRKNANSKNALLNLYPLIANKYTKSQKQKLKNTLKNLLLELYKDDALFKLQIESKTNFLNLFINNMIKGIKKGGSLAKASFPTQKERDLFLALCRYEKKRSLLNYVTVQDDPKDQGLLLCYAPDLILKAFLDQKTYNAIVKKEKEVYYSGRKNSRLTKKEMEQILKGTSYESMVRFESSLSTNKQTYTLSEDGYIVTNGPPNALIKVPLN